MIILLKVLLTVFAVVSLIAGTFTLWIKGIFERIDTERAGGLFVLFFSFLIMLVSWVIIVFGAWRLIYYSLLSYVR